MLQVGCSTSSTRQVGSAPSTPCAPGSSGPKVIQELAQALTPGILYLPLMMTVSAAFAREAPEVGGSLTTASKRCGEDTEV